VDNYKKTKNFALDLLFPKFCLSCQKEGFYLCEDCRGLLEILEFDYCLCERDPLVIPPNQNYGKCHKCKNKSLDGLYFALSYKNKIAQNLIKSFKYPPYVKDLAETLSSILIEHFIKTRKNTDEIWENSILVPVPMYSKKIKERGYNQCEELAKELAKILKIPVVSNVLIKIKHTEAQMELSGQERQKNLLGSFETKNPAGLAGKKIFLVDDVYTTGSTMQECALALRRSGAKSIFGIALAREG